MTDFPISPSDLPWWAWLVGGCVAWFLALLIHAHANDDEGCLELSFIGLFSVIGLLSISIGLIRFVKWVWAS